MGIVVLVILGLFVVVGVARGVSRGKQKSVGHNRCAYCRTHLKVSADKHGYATTCKKCGRTQPWAKAA